MKATQGAAAAAKLALLHEVGGAPTVGYLQSLRDGHILQILEGFVAFGAFQLNF